MSPRAKVALRLVVSASLLMLLAWRVPLGEVRGALGRVPITGLGLGAATLALQNLVGVGRWRRMLARTGEHVPLTALWSDVLVASAYTMVLPSSVGGDVVRALRCGKRLREPHHAWSTTLFERVVGVVSLGLVAVAGVAFAPGATHLLWPAAALAALGAAAMVLADAPLRLIETLAARRAPGLAAMSGAMAADFAGPLGTLSARAEAFAWSVAYQFVGISILTACLLPTGDVRLIQAVYAGVPIVVVLAMLPVTVAGIGLRESLFVAVLGRLGVDRSTALALGLLWLASYIVLALVGVAASWLLPAPGRAGESPEQVARAQDPRRATGHGRKQ